MVINKGQWKIGGEAGFGIMTAGDIFLKACARGGLNGFGYIEYPSLIRGGHNTYQVAISDKPVRAQVHAVDVLVCLNKETAIFHKDELIAGAAVVYDPDKFQLTKEELGKEVILLAVPFSKIAVETAGMELMANNVALGASIAVFDYDIEILTGIIAGQFKGKGEEIITKNVNAARAGYDFVKKIMTSQFHVQLRKGGKPKMTMSGNEAIGIGAIAAGCKFYSGYPMTPTSSLLHFMAAQERKFGMTVKQAEDEISVINMAIGAGFAGVRAMVGTSGGGFCLMTEGLGLAAMTETPIVIILGMRGGPSTGLPTWTEQGDLKFAMNASHGEFPRVVIAPGDMEELFYETMKAFNISEKYQTPVIVMHDKHLAEGHATVDSLDPKKIPLERGERVTGPVENYLRYKITESGVSPRSLPGIPGNIYVANSDEHDERGISTEESGPRKAMFDKRMRKIAHISKEMTKPKLYGPKRAKATIIAWGSTKGAVLDGMDLLQKEGIKVNLVHYTGMLPFPEEETKDLLKGKTPKIIMEISNTGQLHSVIRMYTGIDIKNQFLKYDGRPLYPEEVVQEVKKLIKNDQPTTTK